MGRGGSSGWVAAQLPSRNTMILLCFFCVLWAAVFHLIFQSRLVDTAAGASGAREVAVAAAVVDSAVALLPRLDMQAVVAEMARRNERLIPRVVLELAARHLPAGFSARSFLLGVLLRPALRLLSAAAAWLLRRCGCRSDAGDAELRPRRSSQMDQMYSVDQPARVLLNLQLGETWMNFGYWGAQAPLDLRRTSSAPGLGPGRPAFAEACRSLARLVAVEAKLSSSDRVLDVGCGAGEQDLLWRDEYNVASIVAIDPVEAQINIGRRRVEERGLTKHVSHHRTHAFKACTAAQPAPSACRPRALLSVSLCVSLSRSSCCSAECVHVFTWGFGHCCR